MEPHSFSFDLIHWAAHMHTVAYCRCVLYSQCIGAYCSYSTHATPAPLCHCQRMPIGKESIQIPRWKPTPRGEAAGEGELEALDILCHTPLWREELELDPETCAGEGNPLVDLCDQGAVTPTHN